MENRGWKSSRDSRTVPEFQIHRCLSKITVRNHQSKVKFNLPWLKSIARTALIECLKNSAATEAPLPQLSEVEVTIISDAAIAEVHRQFMQVEGPTDVLTFAHGEILISAETARENAARYGKTPGEELALYIIHGLLHLNGFTDEKPAEAAKMRRAQNRILKNCLLMFV
jgi:probable rRNA maturation factor